MVTQPLDYISDFAPVAPGELWTIGFREGETASSRGGPYLIAHVRAGVWTTTLAPPFVAPKSLHMVSPSDGWLAGFDDTPVIVTHRLIVMHYDGTAWKQVSLGADRSVGYIWMFTDTDGWALGGDRQQVLVLHYHNSRWETTPWPFDGIFLEEIFRVSDDEAWAVGYNKVDATATATPSGGTDILFHFSGGVWTRYGG